MGTSDDSSAEQGDDLTPGIGNGYQAMIPPLREGTVLSAEEAENLDKLPPCSVTEKYTFLLALYIFGKKLSLVMRFVRNKTMKEIQALYYGQFYGTYEYRIWSEWGKWRGKRCEYGEKLFTEFRLKELLSRLLPSVSKRCQDVLIEISRNFLKGKMSFEDYIFKLKDCVGVVLLIEVIGIGKEGNENLTSTAFDEPMSSGKDWSSVTPAEILKFLTSFQRLKKVKMNDRWNDFFWEAVWPRLLARGWQCQQPKGRGMRRSLKTTLVFLVPTSSEKCTKKFSWRLAKGTHYHVSVKKMLKTVASDPSVLALGDQEAVDSNLLKMEEGRFLEPSIESSRNAMTFTIVDTGTLHGNKVTELRSLPVHLLLSATKKDGSTVSVDTEKQPDVGEKGGPSSIVEGTGEARIFIDLNFTYVHVETDQPSIATEKQYINDSAAETQKDEVEAEVGDNVEEQQLVAYNQRKSTRSRPLTKKAWEALENEFGSTRRKRRG